MPRYKLLIEYAGTAYKGWQKQPNAPTVEGEIEAAFARILQQPVDVIGQGRTDSGVHAEEQIAHVDYAEELDLYRLQYALNGILPDDIAIWRMEKVDDEFHARFDALYRRYRYQISRRPHPLRRETSTLVMQELDMQAMDYCAALIKGTHHFDSFTKPDNQNPSAQCRVTLSEFRQEGPLLTYHIQANRFVRHLVRRLVGTMLQVGRGKREAAEFEDMLLKPSKDKNGFGAAARGLILDKVGYETLDDEG
ncbi:tRNA pseudouridine(38-40) synthase TruA [Fodinibius sediminis]|uniref:tRNA pseudouridine synthase A n=1 Tax=Fodinibius sediminis TaxID=1214077 RepID=A0A521EN09_9BACT|nr:tRNA pseudouridine(38-40) synthase TruA [Fodinibius sediminis]SMO85325.1 tRNA pseudouridine38-40 synthase [Fodinibius sediminis]